MSKIQGNLCAGLDHGHMALATQIEDVVTRNARYESSLQEAEILLEQILQLDIPESLSNRIKVHLEKNRI